MLSFLNTNGCFATTKTPLYLRAGWYLLRAELQPSCLSAAPAPFGPKWFQLMTVTFSVSVSMRAIRVKNIEADLILNRSWVSALER